MMVPPNNDDDEDFGLSSSDEAQLIVLVEKSAQSTKRKSSISYDCLPSKRPALEASKTITLATAALTQNFGFDTFRLKQEQVISRILGGGSAVVVFPTGGGKSLCYQVPALVFPEVDRLNNSPVEKDGGITLVVSPLIALMKDQVDTLVKRGIKAAVLDSTKSREEYLHTMDMLRNGDLRLLYCAPERLNNEGFVEQMKHVRGGIRLLAVDEAHCISEWGHAFRPDYLKISRFAMEAKVERVICLTATATAKVAQDICKAFNIDSNQGLFRTSTYRPNLRLLAETAKTKQDLYPMLFDFLKNNPGASIIYVTLQKQTEALAQDLRGEGFNAKAFHAGLDAAVKTKLQEEFMKSENLIMVSTIAFGMGIDKPSIRNVVHFNIPNSLESYSQEIGRAGRDGMPSTCMFYICGEDLHLREIFARGDLPSRQSVSGLLQDIFDSDTVMLPVGAVFRTSHTEQERNFDIRSNTVGHIYAQLELQYGLIRATTPMYTKYSFKANETFAPRLLSDTSPAARAIKLTTRLAKTISHIDVDVAAKRVGIERSDVIRKLNDWNEEHILELRTSGVLSTYKILKPLPKVPAEIENLVSEMYSLMEERERVSLERTEEVINMVTSAACFSRTLANYFGDDLPSGKVECGHCTWCESHEAVIMADSPTILFDWQRFQDVLEAVQDRDDARFLARVAFGIRSPRVTAKKLGSSLMFGSMDDHGFMDLLSAFTKVCCGSNQAIG